MNKKLYFKLLLYSDLSNKAFSNYLSSKLYLHAKCIRKNNKCIYKFLVKNIHCFSPEIHQEIVSLLNHYDIWMTQFSDFMKSKKFTLNEPFVFYHLDDQSQFPNEAIPKILLYLNDKEI